MIFIYINVSLISFLHERLFQKRFTNVFLFNVTFRTHQFFTDIITAKSSSLISHKTANKRYYKYLFMVSALFGGLSPNNRNAFDASALHLNHVSGVLDVVAISFVLQISLNVSTFKLVAMN